MSYPAPTAWSTLDLPQYDIGFGAAVKRGYQKFATFTGRASRREFWFFYLFVVAITITVVPLGVGLAIATSPDNGETPGVPGAIVLGLALVFYLGSLLPLVAASGRRLHDAGYSALLCLLFLASLGIVVLILAIMPTSQNGDRYGPASAGLGYDPAQHPYPGIGGPYAAAPDASYPPAPGYYQNNPNPPQ